MAESAGSLASRPSGRRERARLAAGAAAFLVLLLFLPGGKPWDDFHARLAALKESAGKNLADRRLAGRAPAYDRKFFELILAARKALPPGARGVALFAPDIPTWGGLFLAVYELAPLPVVIAPPRVPPGWVAIAYGRTAAPPNLRPFRQLPGGEMLLPAP